MVKEQQDGVMRHLFFGNIDGGEHRLRLLRFLNVVDGDHRRNVSPFAVLFQAVKDAQGSAVIGAEDGGGQFLFQIGRASCRERV